MPTIDLTEIYTPQPKQAALHGCMANEILYGGAAGPGKSHALRHEGLNWALRIPGLQVYLFRRTFPEIEKNHVLPSLLEFPQAHGAYKSQARRWEFNNGSMLHFAYCQYEQDVFAFQGAEIHLLLIDELTTFTEFQYDYLRSRVRCALDIPDKYKIKIPGIVGASNPGGVGHEFAKRRWVDYGKPMEIKQAPQSEGGMKRCYIPGKLEDNPILTLRDPGYIARLDALPEPYRSAYKDGNWDIFMGQAFNFNREQFVIKPAEIPSYAQRYMTMDWGYGAPFSIGWWWVDSDGRIFRYNEWYGWNGTPNKGLRKTDSEIADGILEREKAMGSMGDRRIIRLAGPDCFQKKPDYKGGGQGPSTAEVFAQKGIYLSPGDPSRTLKIRQFRERLKIDTGTVPMMLIYENCTQFIRTIPLIQTHKTNPEEIDESGEDHVFDEVCHLVMARPLGLQEPKKPKLLSDAHIDSVIKGTADPYEREAVREQGLTRSYITRELTKRRRTEGYNDMD